MTFGSIPRAPPAAIAARWMPCRDTPIYRSGSAFDRQLTAHSGRLRYETSCQKPVVRNDDRANTAMPVSDVITVYDRGHHLIAMYLGEAW